MSDEARKARTAATERRRAQMAVIQIVVLVVMVGLQIAGLASRRWYNVANLNVGVVSPCSPGADCAKVHASLAFVVLGLASVLAMLGLAVQRQRGASWPPNPDLAELIASHACVVCNVIALAVFGSLFVPRCAYYGESMYMIGAVAFGAALFGLSTQPRIVVLFTRLSERVGERRRRRRRMAQGSQVVIVFSAP